MPTVTSTSPNSAPLLILLPPNGLSHSRPQTHGPALHLQTLLRCLDGTTQFQLLSTCQSHRSFTGSAFSSPGSTAFDVSLSSSRPHRAAASLRLPLTAHGHPSSPQPQQLQKTQPTPCLPSSVPASVENMPLSPQLTSSP